MTQGVTIDPPSGIFIALFLFTDNTMKGIAYWTIALALLNPAVDAFAPVASRAGIILPPHSTFGHRRAFVCRSTKAPDSSEAERKQIAVEALEKLLARQQAEVEDTETLLQQLREMDLGQADEETMNRAASVLSGVDYGFVSRSEGASFEKLHGGIYNTTTQGSVYEKYGPPSNIFELGIQQFIRNLNAIKGEYKDEDDIGK